jgi:hypothetical protein
MAKNRKGVGIIKFLFRLMGLALLIGGGILTLVTYEFMDNALPATGSVVSVEVNYGDDSVTYKPTIRYVDHSGRKQRGETFLSSSNYDFRVGSKVNILYDTRNPEKLRMDTWFATWGFGIVFMMASIIPFIIASIINRFSGRKIAPKPARGKRENRTSDKNEEEMIEIRGRTKGLVSHESRSDHEREQNYTPTVRRNR